MSLYVGINNNPKNIVSLLIGNNNDKKEISSAYTGGVNSKNIIYNSFNLDKELSKVNPVDALTSGKITKDDIGKTVYLSNPAIQCQEWRIADINHDGTSGTVDLFPKYILTITGINFGIFQYYANSSLRSYLTTTVYNGFVEEIKNAMKVQAFPSNGETLYDKVKCPSLTELGCNGGDYAYYVLAEGTIYPIFGTVQLRPNNLACYKAVNGGEHTSCWTRSRHINNTSNCMTINDGYCFDIGYRYDACTIACLRF